MDPKKIIGNVAKNPLADYSAVGIVAAYYGLQMQIEALPDLPTWAVFTLMALGMVRAVALQLFVDRDGDGKPDFALTPDQLAKALTDGVKDIDEARALIEKHAKDGKNDVSTDAPESA